MKRFLAFVLGMLLALASMCFAEMDYADLSDEELLSMYSAVINECNSRNLFGEETIYAGKYVANQDIKVGSYKLSAISCDSDKDFVTIAIQAGRHRVWEYALHLGETVVVNLDGTEDRLTRQPFHLFVSGGSCSISEITSSFAP